MTHKFISTTVVILCLFSSHSYSHGVVDEAIHDLEHEISSTPDSAQLYLARAKLYQNSESWDAAMKDYTKAYELDAKLHDALFGQGNVYLKAGQLHKAVPVLQDYLRLKPESSLGHRTLALAYAQHKQYEVSANTFDLAINLDDNPSPQMFLERTRILQKIDPVPIHRIEKSLMQGMRHHGKLATYFELLVESNLLSQRQDRAVHWIDEMPQMLKEMPKWQIKKAQLLEPVNDKAAKDIYRNVVKNIDALPPRKRELAVYREIREEALHALNSHK